MLSGMIQTSNNAISYFLFKSDCSRKYHDALSFRIRHRQLLCLRLFMLSLLITVSLYLQHGTGSLMSTKEPGSGDNATGTYSGDYSKLKS